MNVELFNYGVVDGRKGLTSALEAICKLRYQVYVNECGFERPEDHPCSIEQDEYDQHSIHFYACPRHSDDVIGTARIILGTERPLPIEQYFNIKQFPPGVRREQVAEISRLAVSKEFRCRAFAHAIFGTDRATDRRIQPHASDRMDLRRHYEQQLVRGLYISLYRDSKLRGLTHWFTVMTKALHVILKRWGIDFKQIGPARDYHGIRAPYQISIESIERSLAKNDPAFFHELQSALVH